MTTEIDKDNPNTQASSATSPVLLDITQVSSGWINKYLLRYRLPDATEIEYESVSRKNLEDYRRELNRESSGAADAICIVPRLIGDELVLIKEFRYPLNAWCIAFPAGLLNPGESIISCVERELLEETGYRVCMVDGKPKYKPLPQPSYSSTGMSEECVQVVYTLVEKVAEPTLEHSEFIEVFTLPIAEIPQFLATNKLPIGTRCQLILESFARDSRKKSNSGNESAGI